MDIVPYGHFTLWTICRFTFDLMLKGVSDVDMFVDYLALPGTSCEKFNFPADSSFKMQYCQKNLATSQTTKTFRLTTLPFQF